MDPSDYISFTLEYADQTVLHPLVAFFLLGAAVAVLACKRRYVIIPILIAQNFITSAQRISLGSLDFPILRLLFCVAILRVILRNEHSSFRVNAMDILIFFYSLVVPVMYTLQDPSVGSFTYSLGNTVFDVLISYMVIRVTVRDLDDFRLLIQSVIVISFFVAILFVAESLTGRNIMSAFGGVPSTPTIREGRMRLQGAYPHPILAGSYWASLIPLIIGYSARKRDWAFLRIASFAFAILIILLSASSTPVIAMMIGLAFAVFYHQRQHLRKVLFLAGACVIGLILFWKHPLWYLFTKIDLTGGSTGYYRYLLVNAFITNWKDWILFGIRDTLMWGMGLSLDYAGLRDLANQYVAEGVGGGLFGFGSFMAAIACAFFYVGRLIKAARDEAERRQYWSIGVSIVVFLFNFCGVSYFGSLKYSWWVTLAVCAALYQSCVSARAVPVTPLAVPPDGSARRMGKSLTAGLEHR